MRLLTRGRPYFHGIILSSIAAGMLLAGGCQTKKTTVQSEGFFPHKAGPAPTYYAHCETCKWCKGPFKRLQDAKQTASAHNVKLHDSWKVAYFDMEKCSR